MPSNEIVVPSVGEDVNSDYRPNLKQYHVPIVNEDLLRQRGGVFVDEFVPPCVKMKNGDKFVLVTHRAKDTFHVPQQGMAYVGATEGGTPVWPPFNLTSTSQNRVYPLVSERVVAANKMMQETKGAPCIILSPNPAKPPIKFFALSPSVVHARGILYEGEFVIPLPSSTTPYPLRMAPIYAENSISASRKEERQEKLAIPPKPDNLEDELATGSNGGGGAVAGILIAFGSIALIVGTAYVVYRSHRKYANELPREEMGL